MQHEEQTANTTIIFYGGERSGSRYQNFYSMVVVGCGGLLLTGDFVVAHVAGHMLSGCSNPTAKRVLDRLIAFPRWNR